MKIMYSCIELRERVAEASNNRANRVTVTAKYPPKKLIHLPTGG